MARQYWSSPLGPLEPTSGSAYASSTTITDVSPGATVNAIVVPGGALDLGSVVIIRSFWTASNTGTPTLLSGFYYGGVAGTALAASTAVTTTTAMSGWTWKMEYEGVVQATGTSGKIFGSGKLYVPTSLTAWTIRPIPETTPAQVTIDTTVSKIITTGLTWGTSNASNTATCQFLSVELLS